MPRIRFGVSGTNPERIRKHFESTLRPDFDFPGFVQLEILKPCKIKHVPFPEESQNCAAPSMVGAISFFWRGPSTERPQLVMKFLTALGAPLNPVHQSAPTLPGLRKVMGAPKVATLVLGISSSPLPSPSPLPPPLRPMIS